MDSSERKVPSFRVSDSSEEVEDDQYLIRSIKSGDLEGLVDQVKDEAPA